MGILNGVYEMLEDHYWNAVAYITDTNKITMWIFLHMIGGFSAVLFNFPWLLPLCGFLVIVNIGYIVRSSLVPPFIGEVGLGMYNFVSGTVVSIILAMLYTNIHNDPKLPPNFLVSIKIVFALSLLNLVSFIVSLVNHKTKD